MGFFQTSGILNRRGFFGGATAAAFKPSDIAGLQLWLDATTGLFDATSGGNAVTTDGSSVARWEDQSGNGRHAKQATSNNRPILKTAAKNSKNILRFDGTNDSFKVDAFSLTTKRTVFYAFSSTSNSVQVLYEQGANYNNFNKVGIFYIDSSTKFSVGFRDAGIYSAKDFTTRTSDAVLLELRYNDTHASNKLDQNGSAMTETTTLTGNISGSTSIDLFLAARNQDQFFLNGDIYEIIVYDYELTSGDRTSVRNYLNTKWSIY